jgi:hypothetical protein
MNPPQTTTPSRCDCLKLAGFTKPVVADDRFERKELQL